MCAQILYKNIMLNTGNTFIYEKRILIIEIVPKVMDLLLNYYFYSHVIILILMTLILFLILKFLVYFD